MGTHTLPRVTQLLDELALPSQPLYQQSYPTHFSMSPLGTQITASRRLDFLASGLHPPPLSPAEVWNGEAGPACQSRSSVSHLPRNRALQTGLSDCPGRKTVTSPATGAGGSLSLAAHPPRSSLSAQGFREERSHMPIRSGQPAQGQALLCLRQKVWVLVVCFIIEVIQELF